MNWWQRVIGIFVCPKKTFQYLKEKPDWLIPIIIVLIISLVITAVTLPTIILPERVAKIAENPNIPPEQLEEIQQRMQSPFTIILGLVALIIFYPLLLLIITGAIYGTCTLFEGESTFKQVFSVCSYSSLIGVLAQIIKTPIMFVKQSVNVQTSLALLLPGESLESFWYRLLAHFDLFTLWEIGLTIIGLSIVSKFSKGKSAMLILGLWVIWVLLSSLLGGFFKFG